MTYTVQTRRRSRPLAFSLVELLVTISIISLLIALLLPSLKRARDHSRMTVCLSNMRSQGAAILLYSQEHSGCLPPKHVQWRDANGNNSPWLINAFLARYQHQSFTPVTVGWQTPTGVWRCPEVSMGEDGERTSFSGILHAAPNRWLFDSMEIDDIARTVRTFGDSLPGWEDRVDRLGWSRVEQMRNPADLIAMADNVTCYIQERHRREARESIGTSCDIVTDFDLHTYCGDNVGSHFTMNRRPAAFLDGHADGVPFSSAYWMTLPVQYRPAGTTMGTTRLYAREVRHFYWFIEPADAVSDGWGG